MTQIKIYKPKYWNVNIIITHIIFHHIIVFSFYEQKENKSNETIDINDANDTKNMKIPNIKTNRQLLDKYAKLMAMIQIYSDQFLSVGLSLKNNKNERYIDELYKEISANKRLTYNCWFWAFFYTSSLLYITKKGQIRLPGRIALYSFFFIPNYLLYSSKFRKNKEKIHSMILVDKFSFIKKEREEKEKILKTYADFLNQKFTELM